jgi:putative CocE/NonD family hydrolase
MKSIDKFPFEVREIEHQWVAMPDGCRLAARIWMPKQAEAEPVPAILEYIPYRKNDLTAARDTAMHPYIAGHGYAVVRLDLRGAGDSEGLMLDEYLPRELQDGYDAIQWIAEQPWCDGNVGMVGISWGGFNGLQVAALRPPALKSVISLCSTDDRYATDVHYMGGCLLAEQLSWASIMFGKNTLPPDPRHNPDGWRELWLERLENSGLWLKNWLEHQRRDDFWKHGSVCEDFARIQVPVYAVSGWADGYCPAVFRLMEHLQVPRKGLIGPWAHKYPHLGEPGPAIGFLQEMLRWWDHWLKQRDTGIMAEPMLRLYQQDAARPATHYAERAGCWITEPAWPSPNVTAMHFYPGAGGGLTPDADNAPPGVLTHRSPLRVGMQGAGKWCGYSQPGDQPGDQRMDDALSLCFETAPLDAALDIAGAASLEAELEADRPAAQLVARLVDVHPDGQSTRVAYGVLNLAHRDSHEHPEPLVPGERYRVRLAFKPVAQRFEAGHRIRLALSTSYFPLVWPAPEPVEVTLYTENTRLELPLRAASDADGRPSDFPPPESAPPLQKSVIEPGDNRWRVEHDLVEDRVELRIGDGDGEFVIETIDLSVRNQGFETYRVTADDPDSVSGEVTWEYSMSRGDWRVRTKTQTRLSSDREAFSIEAEQEAWEGDFRVHHKSWRERIPRDGV